MSRSRFFFFVNALESEFRFFFFVQVSFWCYIYRVARRNSVVCCIRNDCFNISWWMRLFAWNSIISISFVLINCYCELIFIEIWWIDWIKIINLVILIKKWRYCRQIIYNSLDTWKWKSKTLSFWFENSINSFFSSKFERNLFDVVNIVNRFDLMIKMFQLKFKKILRDFIERHVMKIMNAHIYVIEFQKRNLSHAYIFFIANFRDKFDKNNIDDVVHAIIFSRKYLNSTRYAKLFTSWLLNK